jgi:hypothetical protein
VELELRCLLDDDDVLGCSIHISSDKRDQEMGMGGVRSSGLYARWIPAALTTGVCSDLTCLHNPIQLNDSIQLCSET